MADVGSRTLVGTPSGDWWLAVFSPEEGAEMMARAAEVIAEFSDDSEGEPILIQLALTADEFRASMEAIGEANDMGIDVDALGVALAQEYWNNPEIPMMNDVADVAREFFSPIWGFLGEEDGDEDEGEVE